MLFKKRKKQKKAYSYEKRNSHYAARWPKDGKFKIAEEEEATCEHNNDNKKMKKQQRLLVPPVCIKDTLIFNSNPLRSECDLNGRHTAEVKKNEIRNKWK